MYNYCLNKYFQIYFLIELLTTKKGKPISVRKKAVCVLIEMGGEKKSQIEKEETHKC